MKLNLEIVRQNIRSLSKKEKKEVLKNLQVALYVLCGEGLLGQFAAKSPAEFYIDSRVKISRKKEIYEKVEVLKIVAEELKLNPYSLEFKCTLYL